jgi:hypothetical protein
MGTDGARNQERLCWRGPAASYCTELASSYLCLQSYVSITFIVFCIKPYPSYIPEIVCRLSYHNRPRLIYFFPRDSYVDFLMEGINYHEWELGSRVAVYLSDKHEFSGRLNWIG